MSDSPIFETDAPPGYPSADAKRHFTIAAGATLAITVAAQFLLPQILMWGTMQGPTFGGMDVTSPHPERAAFWKGQVWFPEEVEGPYESPVQLRHFVPGDEDLPEEKTSVKMSPPWLMPDGDRLWLITQDAVGFLEGDETRVVKPRKRLRTVTRPFLHAGVPAVIEVQPLPQTANESIPLETDPLDEESDNFERLTLWTYEDGEWNEGPDVRLHNPELEFGESQFSVMYGAMDDPDGLTELQVVTTMDGPWVFWQHNKTVYARRGLPFAETTDSQSQDSRESVWEEVGPAEANFTALVVDDRPVVLLTETDGDKANIYGKRRNDQGQWETFFSQPMTFAWNLGACPLDGSGRFAMLSETFVGGMQFVEVQDGRVVKTTSIGGGLFASWFDGGFFTLWIWSSVIPPALSLVSIGILAFLMHRFRTRSHEGGTSHAQFASLLRRTVARLFDSFIFSIPVVIGGYFVWMNFDFEEVFSSGQGILDMIIEGLVIVSAVMLYSVGTLILVGFLEGRFGQSPGKWCVGIRVLRSNLLPCGFWRGLIRNVLIIADQFFNYAVGIALIAFTTKWQRLGDLAADTVVVDVRRSKIEELS